MNKDNFSNSNKSWTTPEIDVLKRIIKHARRDGKSMREAFDQAAYRLERTAGAVYGFWHANVEQDYKDYVKSISPEHPITPPTGETALEQAFRDAEDGYLVEDVSFTLDTGDHIGDEEYMHPEQYHPPEPVGDTRYNLPKLPPRATDEEVRLIIQKTPIYRETRDAILQAQQRQVAYGLDKYPEPLNADTWTILETIDHIISETADKLHYLTMLKIKLQQGTEE